MTVPKHLEEAAHRLEDASERVELARVGPQTDENLRGWLDALTDYVQALAEIHEYTNESIHEKLHELARRLRLEESLRPAARE